MKKMKLLLSLLLSFALASNCYAAPRYTIEDGTGAETGTASNPLKVSLTGGSIPSTSTGLEFYNTADQTTNYEKFTMDWNSNVMELGTFFGGSASGRAVRLGGSSTAGGAANTYFTVDIGAVSNSFFLFTRSSSLAGPFVSLSGLSQIASSGTQTVFGANPSIVQTGTASYIVLDVNPTETSTGSGTKLLQRWAVGGSQKGSVDNTGKHSFDATNTAGGTTGNQTINKPSGTVNFAAAATAITVTNSTVSTSSLVFAQARTNDATCAVKNIVPGSGSFVITMTAACTAETSVGFVVFN